MSRAGRFVARAALVGLGALAAKGALSAVRRAPGADELERTNFHGREVTLAGGPALAAAATATAVLGAGSLPLAAAAAVAGGTAGAVGLYDDIVGARPDQKAAKGFRGHLGALREGRITAGLVKIAGVGLAGVTAAALAEAGSGRRGFRRAINVALGGGVIAGTANLVNLLDLRPGRALKASTLAATTLSTGPNGGLVAGPLGAGLALLPDDLGEEIMLGDAGANAIGALVGLAVVGRTGPWRRAGLLAVLAALTAASEKVSFTKVIESTPVLREFDALGRLPAADDTPADDVAAADTPADHTPVDHRPADHRPADHTPADDVVGDDAPAADVVADDTPADDVAGYGTPADDVATDDGSGERRPGG